MQHVHARTKVTRPETWSASDSDDLIRAPGFCGTCHSALAKKGTSSQEQVAWSAASWLLSCPPTISANVRAGVGPTKARISRGLQGSSLVKKKQGLITCGPLDSHLSEKAGRKLSRRTREQAWTVGVRHIAVCHLTP